MANLDVYLTADQKGRTVTVRGTVDSSTLPRLETVLQRFLSADNLRLTVNLADADYVSVTGWRCLISASEAARKHGVRFVLDGVQPMHLAVLSQLPATSQLTFA